MASSHGLSPAARKRGLITILVDTFLVWCGFNLVIPLISVHYVDKLGWAAVLVGIVLAVRQLMQQGLTPISGMMSDRLGVKGLICTGLLIRAVGFVLLAFSTTFPLLLISCILAGLGGSLFDSPKSASIAALTDGPDRNKYYSILGVVSGLGVTLGSQLGAFLLGVDFGLVALLAAAFFAADFLVTLIFLPSVRVASTGARVTSGFFRVIHDRQFMIFTALLTGFWFLWVQLTISLPLIAKDVSGTTSSVAWVYGINSIMSILLSYPLIRLADRWMRPLIVLILGTTVMAVGFGSIGFAHTLPVLLLCVAVISAGMLLANPSQQTVMAGLASPEALGSYFGVGSLAIAFGGGAGNLFGGLLYDVGRHTHATALPWTVFAIVGIFSAIGLSFLARRQHTDASPLEIEVDGLPEGTAAISAS